MNKPTWFLFNFSNVGIPEHYKVPYLKDVEEYWKNCTANEIKASEEAYYDDSDMFYAGVALTLQGEYDDIEGVSVLEKYH